MEVQRRNLRVGAEQTWDQWVTNELRQAETPRRVFKWHC